MTEQSLTISFGSKKTGDGDGDDWLELEQRPWPEKRSYGFLAWASVNGFVPTINNIFFLYDLYQSECSGEDGSFDTVIHVSKSRHDLQYSLTSTNGILGEKAIAEQVQEKSFTLKSLTNEFDVGTKIDALHSAEWEGNVYKYGGSLTTPPSISLVDGKLSWEGDPIFGVLRVNYTSVVDSWPLNVTAREEIQSDPNTLEKDLKAAYACTVVAVWNEEITALDVEPPPLLGNCNGGLSVCIGDCSNDEDDPVQDQRCLRRIIEVDACTGEKIRDYTEPIVCPEEE